MTLFQWNSIPPRSLHYWKIFDWMIPTLHIIVQYPTSTPSPKYWSDCFFPDSVTFVIVAKVQCIGVSLSLKILNQNSVAKNDGWHLQCYGLKPIHYHDRVGHVDSIWYNLPQFTSTVISTNIWYCFTCAGLDWYYLYDCHWYVKWVFRSIGDVDIRYWYTSGLFPVPLLFTLYVAPLVKITTSFGTLHHQYANNTPSPTRRRLSRKSRPMSAVWTLYIICCLTMTLCWTPQSLRSSSSASPKLDTPEHQERYVSQYCWHTHIVVSFIQGPRCYPQFTFDIWQPYNCYVQGILLLHLNPLSYTCIHTR